MLAASCATSHTTKACSWQLAWQENINSQKSLKVQGPVSAAATGATTAAATPLLEFPAAESAAAALMDCSMAIAARRGPQMGQGLSMRRPVVGFPVIPFLCMYRPSQ